MLLYESELGLDCVAWADRIDDGASVLSGPLAWADRIDDGALALFGLFAWVDRIDDGASALSGSLVGRPY